MKTLVHYGSQFSLAVFVILVAIFTATAQTTTFTYHGNLPDGYSPPCAQCDLQFNLYDEISGTNAPLNPTPIVRENVQVTMNAFTVQLDFGSLFNTGADRYLEIGVRAGDLTGAFTIISPRQQITSAPYAIRSLLAAAADTATDAQNLGGTASGNFVQTTDPRLSDARPPSSGSTNYIQNTSSVQSGANFNIDGNGIANVFDASTQFNIGGSRVLSTAGADNLFVGANSGGSNTDGNNNAFAGYHSGSQNTTGYRNSFFGPYAGFGNTTGHNNTFIGGSAGHGNTTGSYNIFIGESVWLNNAAGNHNTIIGALAAGQFASNPGFFATAIGAASRVSTSDTIVLGKTAGVYDGQSRPADTVQIPGHLQVTGSITAGSFNGSGLTNINASNITTGTLDSARLSVVPVVKGGTGLTSAGASGTFLRSNGTGFTSSALQVGDVPDLSATYIRNQTGVPQSGGFNLSGNGTAAVFNATTQFNLGGSRVLGVAGTKNTFAGINAGASNASGANNAFFGSDAGKDNLSGTDNSFFGVQSGRQNTSGGNNAFFGVNTGYGNTTGHSNSFLGMQAGQGNTTGHNNSFVGYIAGSNNTTGKFNSIFGSNAQVGTGSLSYASAIGANAVVNSSDTIVLGKLAGTYDGVSRAADTVQIPGSLNVSGTISGNINGSSLMNLNAGNITTGTLDDARLSSNVATLAGAQTFTDTKTFAGGIAGNGSALTDLSASNIANGTLDNARLNTVPVSKGGTGITSAGANGNFLRSDGSGFTSSALTASDIPSGNANYIQNTTTEQANANFNISGNGVIGGDLTVSGMLSGNGVGLNNLNAAHLTTGTIDNARLGLISTPNIADGAISTAQIADSAVTAGKIGSNQVVKNLNGLTDNVTLVAGDNVTITPSANTLTIAASAPAASGSFIQNTTTQQAASNFNISGNGTAAGALSGNILNATTQFNIGGNRVLSVAGTDNILVGRGAGVANTTGHSNSFFGANAGLSNTEGNRNSFFGFNSGQSNTTGSDNSFFGRHAGYSNTTGFQNSFVGRSAGLNNTVGNSNSFVGYAAGYSNTTGNVNSFFGTYAGYNNTAGYNNSFVGATAGQSNTTGSSNSFVGTGAGYSNTSGLQGSFLGAYAGYNNTTGNNNSYVGYDAGYSNTTGNHNSFFGVGSGQGNITGYSNVFVGVTAGAANTEGYSNSFFGTNAGISNTTGAYNTMIGANSNVASSNLSYATAVGANAIVTSSNTIMLGRSGGQETVLVPGLLRLNTLGAAGGTAVCRNASNLIAVCSSSLRYKTRITPFLSGLNLVQRLRPISFEWKADGIKDIGFGAEDVAAVEPLLVTYNANGEVEGVKYDRLSAVLINAVKEQQQQIEAQRLQLKQQQGLIEGLLKLICQQNPKADVCR